MLVSVDEQMLLCLKTLKRRIKKTTKGQNIQKTDNKLAKLQFYCIDLDICACTL